MFVRNNQDRGRHSCPSISDLDEVGGGSRAPAPTPSHMKADDGRGYRMSMSSIWIPSYCVSTERSSVVLSQYISLLQPLLPHSWVFGSYSEELKPSRTRVSRSPAKRNGSVSSRGSGNLEGLIVSLVSA